MKRVVVGAHYGLRDWLAQRVTACIMAVYTLLLLGALAFGGPYDHAGWKQLFEHPAIRFGTLLALLSLFYHAWIGLRDVFMDYIQSAALRLVLQVAVILSLLVYTAWTVQILWG